MSSTPRLATNTMFGFPSMTAFVQVLEVLRYNTQFESHKVLVGYSNTTIAADICLPFPPGLQQLKHFPGGSGYHVLIRKGEADQPILTAVAFLLSLSEPETHWEGETFQITGSFHPNSIRFSVWDGRERRRRETGDEGRIPHHLTCGGPGVRWVCASFSL